jgi:hypothetical protein
MATSRVHMTTPRSRCMIVGYGCTCTRGLGGNCCPVSASAQGRLSTCMTSQVRGTCLTFPVFSPTLNGTKQRCHSSEKLKMISCYSAQLPWSCYLGARVFVGCVPYTMHPCHHEREREGIEAPQMFSATALSCSKCTTSEYYSNLAYLRSCART